jgi:hypothetical protein
MQQPLQQNKLQVCYSAVGLDQLDLGRVSDLQPTLLFGLSTPPCSTALSSNSRFCSWMMSFYCLYMLFGSYTSPHDLPTEGPLVIFRLILCGPTTNKLDDTLEIQALAYRSFSVPIVLNFPTNRLLRSSVLQACPRNTTRHQNAQNTFRSSAGEQTLFATHGRT